MLLKLLPFLLFLVFPYISQASTTYEMNPPIQAVSQYCATQNTCTPLVFRYRVPLGTSFDRVLVSVPSTTTSFTGSGAFAGYIYSDNGTPFENCTGSDHSCDDDDTLIMTLGASPTKTNPATGVVQILYASSTTITNSNWYYQANWDLNTFPKTMNYNLTYGDIGYSFNPPNLTSIENKAPTLNFCSGTCTDYTFSPIPNLTSSSWVRMTSPISNSYYNSDTTSTIPLTFQVNTGTTTADNVIVRIQSQNQTFTPYQYTINTTGLSIFTYNLNVPAFADTLLINATLYSSTTSLYVSQEYQINIGTNETNFDLNLPPKTQCELSIFDLTTWWDCAVSFTVYLFIPPQNMTANLAWYASASSSPSVGYLSGATNLINTSLGMGQVSSSTISSLNMSIPIQIPGHATMTIPIISFTDVDDKMGNADEYFRLVCLATLIIFALMTYVGNVQRAWNMISYRGLDT